MSSKFFFILLGSRGEIVVADVRSGELSWRRIVKTKSHHQNHLHTHINLRVVHSLRQEPQPIQRHVHLRLVLRRKHSNQQIVARLHVLHVVARKVELNVALEASEAVVVHRFHVSDAEIRPLEAFRAELAVESDGCRVVSLQMLLHRELRHGDAADHALEAFVKLPDVLVVELLVGETAGFRVDWFEWFARWSTTKAFRSVAVAVKLPRENRQTSKSFESFQVSFK
jgi:hypothetical protein